MMKTCAHDMIQSKKQPWFGTLRARLQKKRGTACTAPAPSISPSWMCQLGSIRIEMKRKYAGSSIKLINSLLENSCCDTMELWNESNEGRGAWWCWTLTLLGVFACSRLMPSINNHPTAEASVKIIKNWLACASANERWICLRMMPNRIVETHLWFPALVELQSTQRGFQQRNSVWKWPWMMTLKAMMRMNLGMMNQQTRKCWHCAPAFLASSFPW